MIFSNPERLWILLIIPGLLVPLFILMRRMGRKSGVRFTNSSVLGAVIARQSQWLRYLAITCSVVSVIMLSLAWARPTGVVKVPRESATVVLVIDTSISMQATDVSPSRLDAAKAAASTFVSDLPAQFNVSIVSLSGNPSVRLPPTTDRTMAKQAISSLRVQESTSIGEAIYVALNAIRIAPKPSDGSNVPGAIVLLSDGFNTGGRSPLQAAADAVTQQVAIHTISFGTDYGYVDLDGKREPVAPDDELLQELANTANGQFWRAETADDLSAVYENVGSQVGYEEVLKESTSLWAGYGLAFAAVAALAAVAMGARWPS